MPTRLPTFWIKLVLAVAVVAAGDVLLFDADGLGMNLGLLLLGATLALAIANRAVWRHRLALLMLLAAFVFAGVQFERPSFVAAALWSLSMAVAALAPRASSGDDGWRWLQRLVAGGLKALVGPVLDLREVLKVRARSRPLKLTAVLLAAILPVVGGVIFLELFATANPVIAQAIAHLSLPAFEPARPVFWLMIGLPVWAVLRPRGLRRTFRTPGIEGDLNLPGVTAASITVSLAVFNLVFALQNGLDIAYLWSGAGLPTGVSFADYAHKGAYPLIATALLAGLFVLVFLRPGSATAAGPTVRWLVIAWVAQNVFLVASTALRTVDYIDAYSLTRMRIAALLWMGLVAIGLLLILWRVLRAKSSGWLINANLAAAGLVLALCSVLDLGALTAAWNVGHAREAGGKGVALDLCYMRTLHGAAVVSLAELERQPVGDDLRDRAEVVRGELLDEMLRKQAVWRGWRYRDARRLDRLATLGFPPTRIVHQIGHNYRCDGSPVQPPTPAPPPQTPPLTPATNPRT
jgi:hypothetical protein